MYQTSFEKSFKKVLKIFKQEVLKASIWKNIKSGRLYALIRTRREMNENGEISPCAQIFWKRTGASFDSVKPPGSVILSHFILTPNIFAELVYNSL